jgi:ABC-type nitrate/sulfonate/bicarbonate transport system substrate-binding protein
MGHVPPQIWYSRSPVVSPLAVAVRTGKLQQAFAQEQIEIASTTEHADETIRSSYFNHHLAWSFRQGGNVPALWARSQGAATKLIGLSWNTEFQALITLPDRGIRNAKDLTGRRYGVPHFAPFGVDLLAPFALKGLVSARAAEGLDIDGVELVDLPVETRVKPYDPNKGDGLGKFSLGGFGANPQIAALFQGKIDAFYVKGVEGVALANAIGASLVSEFGSHPDLWVRLGAGNPRPLTIGDEFVATRPDLVGVLLNTVRSIGPWATGHREDAIRALAADHKASENAVRVALGEDIGAHLGISLKDDELEAFERYRNLLKDWKIIEGDFSLSEWVAPKPLEHALTSPLAQWARD